MYVSKMSYVSNYCKNDLQKFTLMLITGVMCYKYINSWEKLNNVITTKKIFFQLTNQ